MTMVLKKTIKDIESYLKSNLWIKSTYIMDDSAYNDLPEKLYMNAQIEYLGVLIQEHTRVVELNVSVQDLVEQYEVDYPTDDNVLDIQTKASEVLNDLATYLDNNYGFWRNNFPMIRPFKDESVDRNYGAKMTIQVILPNLVSC